MNKNNPAKTIYTTLQTRHGNLHWWPASSPYEVIVGAILTQNTAWSNVEKAIANFTAAGTLTPKAVLASSSESLINTIRPAGFFNQKSAYLKAVTEWYAKYNFDTAAVRAEPLEKLRPELLNVKGVGKETADSILLYAFGFPTFVVDAYTMRLCSRYPLNAGKTYDEVKNYFESSLPRDETLYNNYHALIVINGKDHCRKSKPLCGTCPLTEICEKKGLKI